MFFVSTYVNVNVKIIMKLSSETLHLFRRAKSDLEKARLIHERNEKVSEYKEKLDKMKEEAVQKYCDDMARKLKVIEAYHEKLVEKYVANATRWCVASTLSTDALSSV